MGWTLDFLLENLVYYCTRVVKDWPVLFMSYEHASKNISHQLFVQEIQNSSKNNTTAKLQSMSKITWPSTKLHPSTSTVLDPWATGKTCTEAEDITAPSTSSKELSIITAIFDIDITCVLPKPESKLTKKRQEIGTSNSAETSTHGIIFPPKDGTDPRTPPFGGVTLSKRKQLPESWSGSGGIPAEVQARRYK